MKKLMGVVLIPFALVGLGFSWNRGPAVRPAPKIMGFDAAAGTIPEDDIQATLLTANPSETGLGIYRGVVQADFNPSDPAGEIACDFGPDGVWVFDNLSWHQISGANPAWMFGATLGDVTDEELIANFGPLGLWRWDFGTGYPGSWLQLSGLNSEWGLAADDDRDTRQEVYIDFGAVGFWRWDDDDGSWRQASGLNATCGLKRGGDTGIELACVLFPGIGVWEIYASGAGFAYHPLTGTVTADDDHAAGYFKGSLREALVLDFGSSLGLWFWESLSGWVKIAADGADRVKTARLGTGNQGVLISWNSSPGLSYWHYHIGLPGVIETINATKPDWYGFCEPFDYVADPDFGGINDDELAVDFGAAGLWKYEYYSNTWMQLSGNNPVFMVSGDYYGDGRNTALAVDFGAAGLWLYDGALHSWRQISSRSPDDF